MKTVGYLDSGRKRSWLLTVVIGFGVTFFAYVAVQQSLRLGLNDPQWQIAEDTAMQLSQGGNPDSLIPKTTVDEASSLAPFVTIVDSHLHVLASSGKIGNQVPLPPASAFPDAGRRGAWFTWQHNNNTLRDAAVIMPYQGPHPGYVLVARSMQRVEDTIGHIAILAVLTCIGVVVAATTVVLLV